MVECGILQTECCEYTQLQDRQEAEVVCGVQDNELDRYYMLEPRTCTDFTPVRYKWFLRTATGKMFVGCP